MKIFIVIASLLVVLVTLVQSSSLSTDNLLDTKWAEFKKLHKKAYRHLKEEALRKKIWLDNLNYIEQHNLEAEDGKHTFTLGMNQFGDLESIEFAQQFKLNTNHFDSSKKQVLKTAISSTKDIPDSVDWRQKGCVFPVFEAASACSDLYAIYTAESIAGSYCSIGGKPLVELSAQQILDCSQSSGNQGCMGGSWVNSYAYIKECGGLDSEEAYPFVGKDDVCKFKPDAVAAKITGYHPVFPGNETELTIALALVGPMPTAVDASRPSFQFYQSGIYYDPSCSQTNVDHEMILVGYGSMGKGQDFFTAKNSWGSSWGMQGYVNMARNKNNACGIASYVAYPLIDV